jgi:D-serine deaminase-like pyridoxal phosphate-dependent protein
MASYFADDGWDDITLAFPLNALEVDEINLLASSIKLNLCVVSSDSLRHLLQRLDHRVQIFIEIDTGYHRTGIVPTHHREIEDILSVISGSTLLTFLGFLSHAGHSYAARSVAEIEKVHRDTIAQMKELGDHYRSRYPQLQLSVGDTPICSVVSNYGDMTEIRPGNLVFYDVTQCVIGSCTTEQIAIAMACPVVAVYPERGEVIVHGGGVHFSKDFLRRADGTISFGEVVPLAANGWGSPLPLCYLKSLSQEHGIIHIPTSVIQPIKAGDVLGVLPVHACLTADAMGAYTTLEGTVIGMMPKAL